MQPVAALSRAAEKEKESRRRQRQPKESEVKGAPRSRSIINFGGREKDVEGSGVSKKAGTRNGGGSAAAGRRGGGGAASSARRKEEGRPGGRPAAPASVSPERSSRLRCPRGPRARFPIAPGFDKRTLVGEKIRKIIRLRVTGRIVARGQRVVHECAFGLFGSTARFHGYDDTVKLQVRGECL